MCTEGAEPPRGDLDFGQANYEMINGQLWSGSGGQADFTHGVMFSPNGQGFLALHSTTSAEAAPVHLACTHTAQTESPW